MHRVTDYYGPIVYSHFADPEARYMPDTQKEVYSAFSVNSIRLLLYFPIILSSIRELRSLRVSICCWTVIMTLG